MVLMRLSSSVNTGCMHIIVSSVGDKGDGGFDRIRNNIPPVTKPTKSKLTSVILISVLLTRLIISRTVRERGF